MAAIAGAQVLLFALGAAGVKDLGIFNDTEFLMLTLISMTQAIVEEPERQTRFGRLRGTPHRFLCRLRLSELGQLRAK